MFNQTDLASCMSSVKAIKVSSKEAKGANAEAIAQLGHKTPSGDKPWNRVRHCTQNGYAK